MSRRLHRPPRIERESRRRALRSTGVLAGVLVAVGLGLCRPAFAAADGGLTIYPGQSISTAAIHVRTSAGCPAQADAYYARLRGHGMPTAGAVVTANTHAGMSHVSGFDAYFAETMKDFAADHNATLTGRYDVTVYCIDSFTLTSYRQFVGSLMFVDQNHYHALGTAMPRPGDSGAPTGSPSGEVPSGDVGGSPVPQSSSATTAGGQSPVGYAAYAGTAAPTSGTSLMLVFGLTGLAGVIVAAVLFTERRRRAGTR